MAIVGLITAILTILAPILAAIAKEVAARREKTFENDAAKFDVALAGCDTDALSAAFNELRPPPGYGDTGGQDDPDVAQR
jgi:hypothetical protein